MFYIQVGVYTITALSIERYFDVRETSRRFNEQLKLIIVWIYIILLWIFAIVFPLRMSSSLFVHQRNLTEMKLLKSISECRSTWSSNELSRFIQLKFICAYLLPSILTCTFSFRLILFLHRWSIKSRRTSFSQRSLNIYKRRATTLVLLIIISFFVLWSPLWILQLYDTFNQYGPTPYIQILNFLTLVFVYANGLLNPLIYLILTQNFRDYTQNYRFNWFKSRKSSQINGQIYLHPPSMTPIRSNSPHLLLHPHSTPSSTRHFSSTPV